MLSLSCKKEQKEEVREFLFTELSKMYLHSVCRLSGNDATYGEADFELIEKGIATLKEIIKVKDKKGGFSVDTSTTEDICLCMVDDNAYTDGYHQDKESSIEFALQNVVDKYPNVTVKGEFEISDGCYYTEDKIVTKNGKIIVIHEDGKENSIKEDEKYDEKGFLKDAIEKVPFDEFTKIFKIDGNIFTVKEYKDMLLSAMLKRKTIFDYTSSDYKEFELFIYLYVFDHDCMKITEEEYLGCMKTFVDRLPDPDKYKI